MYGTRDEAVPVHPPFEVVLRGFDRQQVIDHFSALKARVSTIGSERDAAVQRADDLTEQLKQVRHQAAEATAQVDRLRREAEQAATQVDRLERSPLTAATARIQRMLQMAEDEAAELQTSAEQETTSLRESARAEADQLLNEAAARCTRLDLESERRRQTAEAESEARCQAWISDYQTRSTAALYVVLQLAAQRLSSHRAEVQRQVTALGQLRAEVTEQVSAVHRLLVEAVGLVDQPIPAEPADSVPEFPGLPHVSRRQADQPTASYGLHP